MILTAITQYLALVYSSAIIAELERKANKNFGGFWVEPRSAEKATGNTAKTAAWNNILAAALIIGVLRFSI